MNVISVYCQRGREICNKHNLILLWVGNVSDTYDIRNKELTDIIKELQDQNIEFKFDKAILD
jgi:hypothetical protein